MKTIAVMLLTLSTISIASPVDCLARIIHAESRGESLESLAITASAAYNRAGSVNRLCLISKTGEVKASKRIPDAVRPYFRAIANQAIQTQGKIAEGADSWNTGRKPAYKGDIKRISGKHVYYKMR
jgi:hypothetical protein